MNINLQLHRILLLILLLLTFVPTGTSNVREDNIGKGKPINTISPVSRVSICSANGANDSHSIIPLQLQITHFFSTLLDTKSFPARWQCGDWSTFHGWLYILSDLTTWLAYFAIPSILLFFIYERKQSARYHKIVVYFILFILFCGATHLLDAIIFWIPVYKLSALIRFSTAIISMVTVFSLVSVMPEAMKYKSPAETDKIVVELTQANEDLKKEILLRQKAEQQVQDLNEVLAEKVKELEAFSYSVSHDLRSPLRAVHGFAKALTEDNYDHLNEEGKDYLNRINKGAIRMGQLIDDMLLLSQISKKEVNADDANVSLLMNEVVTEAKNSHKIAHYDFDIQEGLIASCDIRLVRIAIENLVNNAIKFSAKALNPKIEFGRNMEADGQPFYIKDNGVGFNMEFSGKLFSPFQRLHSKKDFQGTGIGLAIVGRIITKHNGRIWAESSLGKGATFYFTFNPK